MGVTPLKITWPPKVIFQILEESEFGKVHGDIFNQTKLLVNSVDLRINFNQI